MAVIFEKDTGMRLILALALALASFQVPTANAETTEWMTKREFNRFARKLSRSDRKPVKIRCKAADDFGNILLKVTTAPNPRKDRWNMGIYKGPRLFAGSKVSIDYVTSPKSGANTNCYID
ncbi:MAG: hypothetical protein HPM95_08165 [Alphaproteobacteria bacterium]|nr:hypothetical protein [Alphaproteobacteria bacterium]